MISEERVATHLDMLLNQSEPGAAMHHLHVLAVPRAAGPLGLGDGIAQASVYAIAPVFGDDAPPRAAEDFIARSLQAAQAEHAQRGERIVWAGLSQEIVTVRRVDDLARRLVAAGRLREHPAAAEATMVYAACTDGRRWEGRRWLTGPDAGMTENARCVVGGLLLSERSHEAELVRRLVGLMA